MSHTDGREGVELLSQVSVPTLHTCDGSHGGFVPMKSFLPNLFPTIWPKLDGLPWVRAPSLSAKELSMLSLSPLTSSPHPAFGLEDTMM